MPHRPRRNRRGRLISASSLYWFIVVALAGGIIWYNWRKSTDFVTAAAHHQMVETGEKISDRIKQIYDPLYAIVSIASQASELKAPLIDAGHLETPMLRIMRFYPQILSLYVASTTAISSW